MTPVRALGLWPWAVAPLIAFAAAWASLGADIGGAAYPYAGLLLGAAGVAAARGRIRLGAAGWGVLALFGVYLLTGLARGWLDAGGAEYAALAGAGAIFLIGRACASQFERGEALLNATLALFAATAAAAFIDHAIDPATVFGTAKTYHLNRLSAPFLSANTAATFFALGAVTALGVLLRASREPRPGAEASSTEETARRLALPALTFVLTLTCVFMTASRAGAVLGVGALLALASWDAAARARSSGGLRGGFRTGVLAFAIAVLAAILAMVSSDGLGARLAQTGADPRLDLIQAYWDAIRFAPWFGHGAGGFEFVNDLAATVRNAETLSRQNAAHNVALQWALQAGLAGAALALIVLAAILRAMLGGLTARRRARSYIRAGLVAAGFVFAHGMVDFALEIPAFLWVFTWLLGLMCGSAQGQRRGPRPALAHRLGLAAVCATGVVVCALLTIEHARAARLAAMDDAEAMGVIETGPPEGAVLRRLEVYADRALRLPGAEAEARAALERLVEREPRDGAAWARLAFARMQTGDRAGAATALRRSYERMPYARSGFAVWRLDLSAFIWPGLSEDTRAAAIRQARALGPRARSRFLSRSGVCEGAQRPAICEGET